MKRVLLTGMSGTGKSTVTAALAARGYAAIDADADAWSEWVEITGASEPPGSPAEETGIWRSQDWVWREDRIQHLLSTAAAGILFISGCASNMGRFFPQFDQIILLSAPTPVLVERLATRTTNQYGKHPDELARIVGQVQTIEPLLRRRASLEVDTAAPLAQVIETILAHLRPGE